MSLTTLNWAWNQTAVGGTAKYVLICLSDWASHTGESCFPSIMRIAAKCGISEDTTIRALRLLEEKRLLERRPDFLANKRQTSNQYRLRMERPADPPPVIKPRKTRKRRRGQDIEPVTVPKTMIDPPEIAGGMETGEVPQIAGGLFVEGTPGNLREGTPGNLREGTPGNLRGESFTLFPIVSEERSLLRNGDAVAPHAASTSPTSDVRNELWKGEGKAIVRRLTGMLDSQARTQIGRFLKTADGDCRTVMNVLQAADREIPAEPIPWIVAGIKARMNPEPRFKQAAPELAYRMGLLTPESRRESQATLTRDFSAFGRETADAD